MSKNDNWTLGLIDSAWFGSDYEGKDGREEAKRIGFESLDLFVGFDPGRMSKTNRERYVTENRSAGLPIVSLVCTCLGLSELRWIIASRCTTLAHFSLVPRVFRAAKQSPT
jgi:D-psicose/D-tagatose/L-ribulose 3-epimerase